MSFCDYEQSTYCGNFNSKNPPGPGGCYRQLSPADTRVKTCWTVDGSGPFTSTSDPSNFTFTRTDDSNCTNAKLAINISEAGSSTAQGSVLKETVTADKIDDCDAAYADILTNIAEGVCHDQTAVECASSYVAGLGDWDQVGGGTTEPFPCSTQSTGDSVADKAARLKSCQDGVGKASYCQDDPDKNPPYTCKPLLENYVMNYPGYRKHYREHYRPRESFRHSDRTMGIF